MRVSIWGMEPAYGGPDGLRAATADELLATAKPLAPRMAGRLVDAPTLSPRS